MNYEQEIQAIKQELSLFQLNHLKNHAELDKKLEQFLIRLTEIADKLAYKNFELSKRLEELETARQVQIKLNTRFLAHLEEKPKEVIVSKSWW
jgi:hypothetical protein